jgi:hypothetical protein
MIPLIIGIVGDNWVATIEGSSYDGYIFAGSSQNEQAENVRVLAEMMQNGEEGMTEGIMDVFSNIPSTEGAGNVIMNLFSTTNQLMYEEFVVFSCAEEGSLLEEVVDAATALLTFL